MVVLIPAANYNSMPTATWYSLPVRCQVVNADIYTRVFSMVIVYINFCLGYYSRVATVEDALSKQ